MTGKKPFRNLDKAVTELGYRFDHMNTKQFHVYVHPNHPEIMLSPSVDEHTARVILKKVKRALGVEQRTPKRNPQAVRERQAADRVKWAAESERLAQERADILARRDMYLSGAGARLTDAEVRAIEDRVNEITREQRRIEALMMEAPASARHRGNGGRTHQAGVA